jgi:hypothetical protein
MFRGGAHLTNRKGAGTRRIVLLCSLAALVLPGAAQARKLFTIGLELGVPDGVLENSLGTNKIRDVPDIFDDVSLEDLLPGYVPTDAVTAGIDLRGLPAVISFAAFSNTLRFVVPAAGIDVSFTASSREEARQLLEDWLKGKPGSVLASDRALTQLLQAIVEFSPVDPVAGNPNSLESRMFAADFRMGTAGPLIGDTGGEGAPNLFGVGLAGGIYQGGPWDVYTLDLPINYALNWERISLIFDLPLTATSTEGSWTALGSGGIALQVRPTSWWALTPAFRIGGVGSLDVGGLAVMYSGTITSHIRFPLGPIAVGIGNMGGIATTWDGIEIGGYDLSYDLTNWVTRNGGYLEGTFGVDVLGGPLGWRFFGSDVRFFGDDLYMDSYAEVGATLAMLREVGGAFYDRLGVSLAYLWGRDYDGISLLFGFRF